MKSRNKSSSQVASGEEHSRRVEMLISNLLRSGVIISIVLVLTGTVISYVHHPDYLYSTLALENLTQEDAVFPRTLQDVKDGVFGLGGKAIVTLGLLILIATPVARVAISILVFIYQKDRVYALITLAVLCLLLLSFALGKVE